MPKFSKLSQDRLSECDIRLQRLFNFVIEYYDCSVISSYRDKHQQNLLYKTHRTKLLWPKSKHNVSPCLAVDVVPYPIDWSNREAMYHFGGFVMASAIFLGIPIRWGGDWDVDCDFKDQQWFDLPHFELYPNPQISLSDENSDLYSPKYGAVR